MPLPFIIGGLGGAATGTAGGFAAAGATTSAIMVCNSWRSNIRSRLVGRRCHL